MAFSLKENGYEGKIDIIFMRVSYFSTTKLGYV